MIKTIKNFIKFYFKPHNIILTLYILFILSTTQILKYDFSNSMETLFFLRAMFIRLLIIIPIVSVITYLLNKINIKPKNNYKNLPIKERNKYRFIFFLIPFIVFIIYYIAAFPGGFTNDTINQYYQAQNNFYSDWHPVIHTLIAFKIPLSLTKGYLGSMTLMQIIICSIILSYNINTIYKYTNIKYAIISLLFILLNPNICNLMMYPYKDVAFGYGCLLLVTILINTIYTKNKYLDNKFILFIFSITLAFTTLFRHNAVLFTITFILSLLYFIPKKQFVKIILYSFLIIAFIKLPLYSVLKVEKPKNNVEELLGIPLNVIAGVTKYDYSNDLQNEYEYIYQIAPYETWNEYEYGNYNLIKYNEHTNNDLINEMGAKNILALAEKCFKVSPYISIKSIIKLTNVIYSIDDDYFYPTLLTIVPNDYGIEYKGNVALKNSLFMYLVFMLTFMPHLFLYLGSMHLILLTSTLSKFNIKNRSSISLLLIILPIFIYNFGTMFLLSDCHDVTRFFHYTFILMPIILMYIFNEKTTNTF